MSVKNILTHLVWTTVMVGVVLIVVGVDIMVYGELRSLIALGDERFIVGGLFFLVGMIVLVLEVKSAIRKSSYE